MILTHTTANTNTVSEIHGSAPEGAAAPGKTGIWQAMTKWFWDYTEATGKADTKSFDGLL